MANYDEALVGDYSLPDPLVFSGGARVATADDWRRRRRPELMELFGREVFGRTPPTADAFKAVPELVEEDGRALGGSAIRRQVSLLCRTDAGELRIGVLLYLPARARGPAPLFAGLNFFGNHTVGADPAIVPTGEAHRARGEQSGRWPIARILERGYGVATAWCGDADPDFDDGFRNGAHSLFRRAAPAGQAAPAARAADEWGTIGAWAWSLSRMMDHFVADPDIDAGRVAVFGHSRLGKTALWAGARDERFALVVSNASGCGGAALSRRNFGETVAAINERFPHWFCGGFKKYGGDPASLPVDQHELLACIAPRPLYVASASEDLWADPKGEFLSALHASPVYRLLGEEGLSAAEMPAVHQPAADGRIGYHIRAGVHEIAAYDWERFMDFADRNMGAAE